MPMGIICGSTTDAKCAPMPRRASGRLNHAVSTATRMSHASASSNPPAVAGPFTIARIGLRDSSMTSKAVRSGWWSGPR